MPDWIRRDARCRAGKSSWDFKPGRERTLPGVRMCAGVLQAAVVQRGQPTKVGAPMLFGDVGSTEMAAIVSRAMASSSLVGTTITVTGEP